MTPATHVVSLAVMAAVALGCTTDSETKREEAASHAPAVVTITATDYAFEAPDTVPAGWTTFRLMNHGATLHMGQLVELEEGRTLAEFREAYYEAWRTVGPRPAWGVRSGGPGPAEPGASSNATLDLEPGSYAWYDPMYGEDKVPYVFGKGMARPFVVTASGGETSGQAAPEPTVTITMTEYAFRPSAPLTAGRHLIRVENLGREPHEASLIKLAPGKTLDDLQAWLRGFEGPPPASILGGVAALAANHQAYFEADLTPGDYVLLCFVTAPDGRPHAEHGMIQEIPVE